MPFETPSIIYHYCSAEALVEILRSQELWMTHVAGLNDYQEGTWVVSKIRRTLTSLRTPATASRIDAIAAQYDLSANGEQNVFVTSFSEDGDLLSQWRAYGRDGSGFAIGFRTSALGIKHEVPHLSFAPQDTLGLFPVHYDAAELQHYLAQVIHTALEWPESPENAVIQTAMSLRRAALLFKNPGFAEEKEWRIAYRPMIWNSKPNDPPNIEVIGPIKDIRFRATSFGVVPFFGLRLPPERKDLIAEVVLGPRNTSAFLNMHLRSHGFEGVKIRKSSTSYR